MLRTCRLAHEKRNVKYEEMHESPNTRLLSECDDFISELEFGLERSLAGKYFVPYTLAVRLHYLTLRPRHPPVEKARYRRSTKRSHTNDRKALICLFLQCSTPSPEPIPPHVPALLPTQLGVSIATNYKQHNRRGTQAHTRGKRFVRIICSTEVPSLTRVHLSARNNSLQQLHTVARQACEYEHTSEGNEAACHIWKSHQLRA
jgi:hypothetical protein